MSALGLTVAYLREKPLNTFLNMLLLALGIGTISLLLLFSDQLDHRMRSDARGIDMVVGAKGSPTQLILSSVYHMDVPTGNILLSDAEMLDQHPMIANTIPLALGDSFRGFRIVGTSQAYPENYNASLADGRYWDRPLEATIGASVAAGTGLRVGDRFVGSHGFAGGGSQHEATPFTVVGIMSATGSVIDRTILTAVDSVWAMHGIHGPKSESGHGDQSSDGDHAEDSGHEEHATPPEAQGDHPDTAQVHGQPLEITAILVQFKTPVAAVTVPRQINMQTPMQAARPGYEIARLQRLIGAGIEGFRAFAFILVASAALGIFVALYNAISERRYDIAIMRAMGSSRGQILRMVILEGLLLSVAGVGLGIILGHGAAEVAGGWLWREHQVYLTGLAWVPAEGWLFALAIGVGFIAAILPAIQAYRTDIASILAQG